MIKNSISLKALMATITICASQLALAQLPLGLTSGIGNSINIASPGFGDMGDTLAFPSSSSGSSRTLDMPSGPLPGMSDSPANPPADRFANGGQQLIFLGANVVQQPDILLRVMEKTVIPVGYTIFPVSEVLANDPAGLPDYFANGGTILLPDIAIAPRAPLVNEPLNLQ